MNNQGRSKGDTSNLTLKMNKRNENPNPNLNPMPSHANSETHSKDPADSRKRVSTTYCGRVED